MEGRGVRFLFVIPVFLLILMAHNAHSQSSSSEKKSLAQEGAARSKRNASNLSPAASAWVESTLRKMSVDEKIGQLLFTTYYGGFTATDSPAYQQLLHDVQDLHVGGFIVITHS